MHSQILNETVAYRGTCTFYVDIVIWLGTIWNDHVDSTALQIITNMWESEMQANKWDAARMYVDHWNNYSVKQTRLHNQIR